jgi:SWI/SNF-related matrix-associated actin-dependent regulator of chromatin subfamily A member 5
LKHHLGIASTHLVVVPTSTLQNWACEFKQWTPDVNVVVLTGPKEERADIITNQIIPQDFEVCITSYLLRNQPSNKFSFKYIIIDKAHHIENVNSILLQVIQSFISPE